MQDDTIPLRVIKFRCPCLGDAPGGWPQLERRA